MRQLPLALVVVVFSALLPVARTEAANEVITSSGYIKSIYIDPDRGFQIELDISTNLCPVFHVAGVLDPIPRFWVEKGLSSQMSLVMSAMMGVRKVILKSSPVKVGPNYPYCVVSELAIAPPF